MPHCAAAAADIRCAGAAAGARNWTLAEHGPASAAAVAVAFRVSHCSIVLTAAQNETDLGYELCLREGKGFGGVSSEASFIHSDDCVQIMLTHHDSLKFKTLLKSSSNISKNHFWDLLKYNSLFQC